MDQLVTEKKYINHFSFFFVAQVSLEDTLPTAIDNICKKKFFSPLKELIFSSKNWSGSIGLIAYFLDGIILFKSAPSFTNLVICERFICVETNGEPLPLLFL